MKTSQLKSNWDYLLRTFYSKESHDHLSLPEIQKQAGGREALWGKKGQEFCYVLNERYCWKKVGEGLMRSRTSFMIGLGSTFDVLLLVLSWKWGRNIKREEGCWQSSIMSWQFWMGWFPGLVAVEIVGPSSIAIYGLTKPTCIFSLSFSIWYTVVTTYGKNSYRFIRF